jgi:hypothetical protein
LFEKRAGMALNPTIWYGDEDSKKLFVRQGFQDGKHVRRKRDLVDGVLDGWISVVVNVG